jgi:hypothetical protein
MCNGYISVSQMSASQMSASQMSASQMSVNQMPVLLNVGLPNIDSKRTVCQVSAGVGKKSTDEISVGRMSLG